MGLWLLVFAVGSAALVVRTIVAVVMSTTLVTVLVAAVGLSLLVGVLSHQSSGERLLSRLPVSELPHSRAPSLHASLDRLHERMAVDRPTLYLSRTNTPTAFVLGTDALVIDKSLLRLLSPAEIEGVFAHELAHLERNDGLLRTLIESVLRVLVSLLLMFVIVLLVVLTMFGWGLSLLMDRPVSGSHTVGHRIRRLFVRCTLVLFIAPTLLLRAYARHQEHAADKRAVEVLDDPLALALALESIQQANEPPESIVAVLFPKRAQKTNRLQRALATHPPTDERIERVRALARNADSSNSVTYIDIE